MTTAAYQAALERIRAAPLPSDAVWVENCPALIAHSRCLELAADGHLYLKGPAVREGYTSAELRAEGLAGIYRWVL